MAAISPPKQNCRSISWRRLDRKPSLGLGDRGAGLSALQLSHLFAVILAFPAVTMPIWIYREVVWAYCSRYPLDQFVTHL